MTIDNEPIRNTDECALISGESFTQLHAAAYAEMQMHVCALESLYNPSRKMLNRNESIAVDKKSPFTAMVLSVLFALTFEKALAGSLGRIATYHSTWQVHDKFVSNPLHYLARLCQLFAFLLTLFRFYAGAYRFHQEAPESKHWYGDVWNLTNTTLLFVGFYVAALLVTTRGMFALFVAGFHLIDLAWFGVGRPLLRGTRSLERALDWFVAFDAITLACFGVIGFWWWIARFDTKWIQLATSVLLMVMFAVDVVWKCRNFYFAPKEWRKASSNATNSSTADANDRTVGVPMSSVKIVYFAGPLFTQAEREWNMAVSRELSRLGFDVLLPQEQAKTILAEERGLTPTARRRLFRAAIASIERAHAVVAILDGPDPDSGTCFECGYAHAKGVPVIGIRTDLRYGGDDSEKGVNLMLSASCRECLSLGVEALETNVQFIAERIVETLRRIS